MSRARAEVGDVVQDAAGQQAIVTDIRRSGSSGTWVLRPRWGPTTAQWETAEPDSLTVVETRASRFSSGEDAW
ncbi:hypothetical protein [Streptomyces sp. GQFP]|uniref:hypothetical protein n=1 Tax=Streptomyces sp. GQFP TaxID=2907545 RepID=UPI001F18777E|nr:hypothetical protein [Streptomyces sp. GQFP]UIX32828.1 hypothetical protein LUX31_23985 [Streptomyces sp. GQFP]